MPSSLRASLRDVNFWIAVFTAFASLAAMVSTLVAWQTAKSAEEINLQGQLRGQIFLYQAEYARLINDIADPFSVAGYSRLSENNKIRVQIVDGMLVGVIDLMFQTKDRRASTWAGFLPAIAGPLACGYPLELYAGDNATLDAIRKAKEKALKIPCEAS